MIKVPCTGLSVRSTLYCISVYAYCVYVPLPVLAEYCSMPLKQQQYHGCWLGRRCLACLLAPALMHIHAILVTTAYTGHCCVYSRSCVVQHTRRWRLRKWSMHAVYLLCVEHACIMRLFEVQFPRLKRRIYCTAQNLDLLLLEHVCFIHQNHSIRELLQVVA